MGERRALPGGLGGHALQLGQVGHPGRKVDVTQVRELGDGVEAIRLARIAGDEDEVALALWLGLRLQVRDGRVDRPTAVIDA